MSGDLAWCGEMSRVGSEDSKVVRSGSAVFKVSVE